MPTTKKKINFNFVRRDDDDDDESRLFYSLNETYFTSALKATTPTAKNSSIDEMACVCA